MAALNAEVTRQAAMVAYVDDFKLIMLIALASRSVPQFALSHAMIWSRRLPLAYAASSTTTPQTTPVTPAISWGPTSSFSGTRGSAARSPRDSRR